MAQRQTRSKVGGTSSAMTALVLSLLLCVWMIPQEGDAFSTSRATIGSTRQAQQPPSTRIISSPLFMGRNNNKSEDNNNNNAPPLKRNPPRKICLLVEPTPFTHVSGYANRFKEMLKFLAKAGDQVDILTVDSKTPAAELPKSAFGFKIRHTQGFTFPLYNHISLTLDLPEMKGARMIEKFKPDLIHVTSP